MHICIAITSKDFTGLLGQFLGPHSALLPPLGKAVFPATAAGLAPVSLLGAPGCECRSHSLWPDVQTWTTDPGGGGGTPELWEPRQGLRRLAEDPHPEARQPPQLSTPGSSLNTMFGEK